MGQQPSVGQDVTHLMGGASAPPVGADVSHLMGGGDLPTFRETNAKDASGNAVVNAASDFLGEATQGLNPVNVYHALKSIATDLPGTLKQIGQAQGSLYLKAQDSYQKGDYTAAARHMADYLLPIIGPRLDQAGDYMQQGQYAKGLGATADIGLQMAIPQMAGKISASTRGVLRGNPNPVEASAVAFGQREGIPVDAGTATGSQFAKNVQKRLGGTLGGSNVVEDAQRAQNAGLTRVGGNLAANANAGAAAASPVSAGEGVADALAQRIRDSHAAANTAYTHLRSLEQAKGGVPVDVSGAKTALQPMYDGLLRESELTSLQGGKARVLVALDKLMKGPDSVPLSVADSALGDLKALSRTSDMPELRTQGQGVAAKAVSQLDAQVSAAAYGAGNSVKKALDAGRAATIEKYRVADVRDLLSGEPAQVFRQLTANKDTALNRLKAVQGVAPDALPDVARGYLEHAMDTATEAGGFAHADKLFADWQKLGPQTKQILFPQPGQIQALNDFFLLAKKLKENPNPSGTAVTVDALKPMQILGYLPTKVLAKVLYTPRGVKALTTGMRISVNASPAAKAAAMTQVVRAAQEAGIALPAAAQDQGTPGAGQ